MVLLKKSNRPQFHFTPLFNWMNDPNGMVFFDGEYHLFYQYNPDGDSWGHISWGHAVSKDLLNWEHLPIALAEENGEMIFSGSAVIDWKNTSGFQKGSNPPMIAIYTGHRATDPVQQHQCIAYSNDRGRSWTKYELNPVLDIGVCDFRDPKVFWHKDTQHWIMAVALSAEQRIQFYTSVNLKDWSHVSDFTVANPLDNLWECPDLFPLPIDGDSSRIKWVLVISVNPGALHGGSGMIYLIGDFNGEVFTPDQEFIPGDPELPFKERMHWVDHGKDFYAAVTWSDIPKKDGRRIWLGWMNSWEYAREIPTTPWRGMMSIPRTLGLSSTPKGIRLVQKPINELQILRCGINEFSNLNFKNHFKLPNAIKLNSNQYELIINIDLINTDLFGIRLCIGPEQSTIIEYNKVQNQITFDRTQSGSTDFHSDFPTRYSGELPFRSDGLNLNIFVDQNSIEIFANDGLFVSSNQIFPSVDATEIELFCSGEMTIDSLRIWELRPTGSAL